jgi:hypothetical protein
MAKYKRTVPGEIGGIADKREPITETKRLLSPNEQINNKQ